VAIAMTAGRVLGPCTAGRPHYAHAAAQVTGDLRVPAPAAAASTILARSTSSCGLVPAAMTCRSFLSA
jgi:hypothetical protein